MRAIFQREREKGRENNHFSRENVRENIKKFVENNMRRKIVKIKNIVIHTKLSKSCYVM